MCFRKASSAKDHKYILLEVGKKERKEKFVEKAKKTSSDTDIHRMCMCVYNHEQWMCLGMQRRTHITLVTSIYVCVVKVSSVSEIN